MFLPAAGDCSYGSFYNQGSYGYYWSSTPRYASGAFYLGFNSGDQLVGNFSRFNGFSVRAVLAE